MAVQIDSENIHAIKVTQNSTTYSVKDIVTSSGTHVWCTPPSVGTTYTITRYGHSSSDYTYKLSFKIVNNSTKSVTYTCKIGIKTATVTVAAGDYENPTFDFGSTNPGTSGIIATIQYLGDSVSARVAYGTTNTLA